MIALATETRNLTPDAIREAMTRVAATLAVELADEIGVDLLGVSDFDLTRAMLQPLTLAAVLDDLCRVLGIAPPPAVRAALHLHLPTCPRPLGGDVFDLHLPED